MHIYHLEVQLSDKCSDLYCLKTHHLFKELFRETLSRFPVLTPLTMAFDLKDETEVKDYIEKLGVEYRFGCYSEKNPEGILIIQLFIIF